ncbi:MAG: hypothetical protein P8H35_00365 [Flavobacteriales bacterium]|nr:hypothetical protein [Flavobacteriales bacterium]
MPYYTYEGWVRHNQEGCTNTNTRSKSNTMGKGMKPKQGYNQKLYDSNYDEINWSKSKKKNANNKATDKQIEKEKEK